MENKPEAKDYKMVILVELKSVYGKELIYPVNKTAQLFARLVDKKTFSRPHIETIKELGFSVELTQGKREL